MATERRVLSCGFVILATLPACASAGGGGAEPGGAAIDGAAGWTASGGGSSGHAGGPANGGFGAALGGTSGSGGSAGSVVDSGGAPQGCASPVFEIVSGQGAAVMASNWSSVVLRVRASCAASPLSGVNVSWSVTEGDAGLSETTQVPVAKTYQSTTGPDGIAEAIFRQPASMSQPLQSNQPGSVHVESSLGSADFIVTVFSPGSSYPTPPLVKIVVPENGGNWSDIGSGKAGTVLTGALEVVVVNQTGWSSGQGVPNIGFWVEEASVPGLHCVGPAHTVLSAADGKATCDLQLPAEPGPVSFKLMAGGSQWFQGLKLEVTP